MQTPEAFIVGYTPVRAAGRVARGESLMRRALWSVLIYVAITVGLWFWLRDQLTLTQVLLGGIPSAVIVLGFVVWRWVELRSARRSLASVPAGEALRIDHRGLAVRAGSNGGEGADQPKFFDWTGLSALRAAGSRVGTGPNLLVEHAQGAWSVPLSYLDTLPGTIDSAVRAYSGGLRGLDLSGLDTIFSE